jgi:hypothetical protein
VRRLGYWYVWSALALRSRLSGLPYALSKPTNPKKYPCGGDEFRDAGPSKHLVCFGSSFKPLKMPQFPSKTLVFRAPLEQVCFSTPTQTHHPLRFTHSRPQTPCATNAMASKGGIHFAGQRYRSAGSGGASPNLVCSSMSQAPGCQTARVIDD